MKFSEIYKQMLDEHCSRSLPDEYLREQGCETREEYGIGEYAYGIVTVPVDWVLPYFETINKIFNENSDFCNICCAKDKCNGMCCYEQLKEMFEECWKG